MNWFVKWLVRHNSQTKFFTLSAIVATIIFLDPFRERNERVLEAGAFATRLPPPSTSEEGTVLGVQITEEIETNTSAAIVAEASAPKLRSMRRRVVQLLQRVRQSDAEHIKQRTTFTTTDAQVEQLMTAADRYMCTTEMATLLAIMHVGGPQRLLYWDNEWDAATSRAVYRIHQALRKGCRDDIEFALKLYTAWSETRYQEQSLAPQWALRETWQPYRLPILPKALEEALGTHLTHFKKDIGKAYDIENIDLLVSQYGVREIADAWFTEVKAALQQARQEAWARAFFVHHGLLAYKVEPERERLLVERSVNKKTLERRPINFDLLQRLRILFAHYLVQHTETGPVVPSILALEPDWLTWLRQQEHSALSLARFIAQQTARNNANELLPTQTDQRLFLDQRIPLGSRYICTITHTHPDGSLSVAFTRHLADAPPTLESFRGEASFLRSTQLNAYVIDYEHKDSIEEALLTSPPAQHRAFAGITGCLQPADLSATANTEEKIYQINAPLLVEVSDYNFDDPAHPFVIVKPVPTQEPFQVFHDLHQIGDVVTVHTLGYDERPDDTLISLIVEEPRSHLTILLEPEQVSFTPLGEAIKEILPNTQLHLILEEIDTLKRTVTLSLLPLMEVHLDKILKSLPAENGTYQATGTISKVFAESILLVLHWSDPALGLIYALEIPRAMLPYPQQQCEIGDVVTLQLLFPDHVTSLEIHHLPSEVRQIIEMTHQERFSIYWENNRLHFHGQMPYHIQNKFLSLSTDKIYHYNIRHLYRNSYQFLAEVLTIAHQPTQAKIVQSDNEQDALSYVRVLASSEIQSENEIEYDETDETFTEEHHSPINAELTEDSASSVPIMTYQIGQIVEGRVTGVQSYGAFVEIEPGVSGLVHKSKMWGYVPDMSELVHMGDVVKVLILNVNVEQSNLELSMQLPEYDPLRNYHEGDIVTGRVTDIQEFGAFVQIEPGVSGLVHKSKMWGYVSDVANVVSIGDKVTVRILTINREKHWLELSMQVQEHDPLLRYKVGEIVTGVVTDVKDFGAFVEIEPGASGLIYRTDIRENVSDARRELFVGDEVEVLIVRIDMERRHMALSMKDI